MAQQTFCPACGGPLEYSGPNDVITCGFCNTELRVLREDDQISFQVLSQPGPQKEVLSTPVEPQVPGAVIFDLPDEQRITPGSSSTFASSEPVFTPPPGPAEGSQVYQPVSQAPRSNTTRNWILIAVGIIAGVCLLCLCIGVVLVLVFNVSAGTGF